MFETVRLLKILGWVVFRVRVFDRSALVTIVSFLFQLYLLFVGVILHVLSQTARVCIFFCASDYLTCVRFLKQN